MRHPTFWVKISGQWFVMARPIRLDLTINTQPLMLMAGIAVYRAWKALGEVKPVFMAGHSLGEYTALVASGALAFDVPYRSCVFVRR